MEDVTQLWAWFIEHRADIISALGALWAFVSIIVSLTPSTEDDHWLRRVAERISGLAPSNSPTLFSFPGRRPSNKRSTPPLPVLCFAMCALTLLSACGASALEVRTRTAAGLDSAAHTYQSAVARHVQEVANEAARRCRQASATANCRGPVEAAVAERAELVASADTIEGLSHAYIEAVLCRALAEDSADERSRCRVLHAIADDLVDAFNDARPIAIRYGLSPPVIPGWVSALLARRGDP